MSYHPDRNRRTLDQIVETMPHLIDSSADGAWATWQSRLALTQDETHIALNFERELIVKSHQATFDADYDGKELQIMVRDIAPAAHHSAADRAVYRPGITLARRSIFYPTRYREALPVGLADEFIVRAVRYTGQVSLQALHQGEPIEGPYLRDDIDTAQFFLAACRNAIVSPHLGKFKPHTPHAQEQPL